MANEVSDVSPSSIAHIVGQKGVVEQVKVTLDAAFADNRKFDNALLVGPPGLGKSALAAVIASEMATDFIEVLGQSITGPADLNALLLRATDKAVVHLDEAHELKKEFQTALYLAIDKRTIFVGGKHGAPQQIPIANFTLLLSTTDEYDLLQPLRDRQRLTLRFQFYSVEELTLLLQQRCRALCWTVQDELLPLIAQRSRGTPRLALRLLQASHRVCRAEGDETIRQKHLKRACDLEQLDELGLGPTEQQYIRLLAVSDSRLNVLASALGLPSRTVSQVIEPFLIRAGLVTKDDQGRRQLTALGHKRASKKRAISV